MLNCRTLGPVNGYFVSVIALCMGDFGDRHQGFFRVFEKEPDDYFAEGWLTSGENTAWRSSRAQALQEAMENGFATAMRMPAGRCQPRAHGAELACILYVSQASEGISRQDLTAMLDIARERNVDLGITGHLMFIDDRFMHYIEGTPTHLELVYFLIRRDPMHRGIIELMHEDIAQRAYSDWTLAFERPEDPYWDRQAPNLPNPQSHGEAVFACLVHFSRSLNVPRLAR